jgi:hypothetical protein
MRRIFPLIIVMAMLFGLRVTTYAAPFLVCDEYTTPPPRNTCLPDTFLVQLDNGVWIQTPAQVNPNTGNTRLHFDLSGLPAGSHTVKVKAKCSQRNLESAESTPFSFMK